MGDLSKQNGIDVEYRGAHLKMMGRDIVLSVLIIGLIVLSIWFALERRAEQGERQREHVGINEELAITNWLLSKPVEKRPELSMPKAARQRLKRTPSDKSVDPSSWLYDNSLSK